MNYNREQNLVRTQAKLHKPKTRQQQQGHFDPEELTRRLYIVLADQKAHAERKRARAKAEEAKAKEKDGWSWTGRHHNKDAAERRSKEAVRDTATALSSKETSLKPTLSTSSGELKRQKSAKLSAQRKEPKTTLVKDVPKASPEPAPVGYHHVPQEAAKQFQRTTTVDGMRDSTSTSSNLAHKLSKQALKLHLAAGAAAHSSSLRAVVESDDKTISPVERLLKDRERVDDWRSRIPEEAAEVVEDEREEYHVAPQYPEHTFHAELARLKPAEHPDQNRRKSTGDILAKGEDNRLSMVLVDRASLGDVLEDAKAHPDPAAVDEHRVDWTQSDEQAAAAAAAAEAVIIGPADAPAQRHKPLLSPLLRKADSIWTLRGRLGSGSKEKGDLAQIPESPRSPKEPKGSFFAKFKR
ncbi:hypothetical protein CONLIGDRAFT_682358 [Coniochaeta ligniaria NRRL 30616]|uniref:Uncharacterized protein n=1 Tax=Coniochaeta ligniaria NRRL 30616 TaxID=1408157 RepID=A0A1J7IIT5_9PEZI|nr:hypothetical protein CONLIGDRAFT_682358 [Coniochaeta ligniaria NRRL 30616]